MIKRKIDRYLEEYYDSTKKALLITGARQTGKTYSIRNFGKSHFESMVEINFIEMSDAGSVLSTAKNSRDLLLRISSLTTQPLIEGKTLIFFDEVQECPEIVTAIKFLVDEGNYRYIMSGSLLGVELNDLRSEPVGYMDVKEMFPWLMEAGVALPVYNVEEPVIPLKLSRSRNLFKLFQNDVGLLASQYADGIQLRLLTDAKSINFGSVYENAIAQELSAHGFDLYYFNSKRQGELDFVIEKSGAILPIEVKSGKDYHRHNALSNLMSNQNYPIPEAIVFSNENFRQTDKVMYLPVYLAMFIEKQTPVDITYKVDLSGL